MVLVLTLNQPIAIWQCRKDPAYSTIPLHLYPQCLRTAVKPSLNIGVYEYLSIYVISSKPPQHLQSAAGIIRDMTQKMGIRVLFLHDSCAILIDIVIEDMEIYAKTPFQYPPTLSVIQRTYMPPPPPLNTIEISLATPGTPFLSAQCRVWGNTNFTLLAKVVD